MFCEKCGAQNNGSKFCGKCGSPCSEVQQYQQIGAVNPTPIKKKSKAPLITFLSIFMVAILGVSGYFGYNVYLEKKLASEIEKFFVVYDGFLRDSKYDILEADGAPYMLVTTYDSLVSKGEEMSTHDVIAMHYPEQITNEILDFSEQVDIHIETLMDEYKTEVLEYDLSICSDEEQATISNSLEKLESVKESVDFESFLKIQDEISVAYYGFVGGSGEIMSAVADFDIEQIDTTDFPNINVYLSAKDDSGQAIESINSKFLTLTEFANGNTYDVTIDEINKLNQNEALNINLVADVSGSMQGNPFSEAKTAMSMLVNEMQFNVGDALELTSFSTNVSINQSFTSDKDRILSAINNLQLGDMTSFYDALYVAVNSTAAQTGAKYVMAFTDGADNTSAKTQADVIRLSNYYRVPIYIVSVGMDDKSLSSMAEQTGGKYYYLDNFSKISDIYDEIYTDQKDMFKISYVTSETESTNVSHEIKIDYTSRDYTASVSSEFEPNVLYNLDSSVAFTDEIDIAIYNYLHGFVSAINAKDYSLLRGAVVAGSSMESIQSKYILNDITESLLSYEILSKEKIDNDTYHVETREVYNIYGSNSSVKLLSQDACYIVKRDVDGQFRLAGFVRSVKKSEL